MTLPSGFLNASTSPKVPVVPIRCAPESTKYEKCRKR
jgi:hypothetical protein